MKSNWLLLLVGGLTAVAPATTRAEHPSAQPMFVTNLTGNLHIQQGTPSGCSTVDQTTPLVQGRLEITPAEGIDFGALKYFVLTSARVSFAPFSVHVACLGGTVSRTRSYGEMGVQLTGGPADFLGFPSNTSAFDVTIPRQKVLMYEAAIVDGEPETAYTRPKEDVTGVIDLEQGTVQLQVAFGTRIHFEWPSGCADSNLLPCFIGPKDEEGTLTATLSGTIVFPDTDGDGVADRDDNCPFVANREQGPVPPLIRVPSEVTVASCASPRLGPPIGIDVCRDLTIQVTDDAPDIFRPGANLVTYTAVDAQGYTATARQTVTVSDATPPVFTSLPGDLRLDNCGPARLDLPTVEDDCGGTPTLGNNAPRSFAVGRTEVTWTATDAYGNRAAATQVVTVKDAVLPAAACVPADRLGVLYQVGATDTCTASPTIRLGSYTLKNGETIAIKETKEPGVRFAGTDANGIAQYEVGSGEAVITASDESGNVAAARCR